ncbi:armadillo-type protein [Morchella snyderi]|nr:armadillo-type protein [Morchella snyderi]
MTTDATSRPQHIEEILSGLDRYNPETVSTFQDYVQSQCENRTYDNMANLALLKLYQFNPHLTRDETITNILVKALTVFPSPDFSLCLHLLPPNSLIEPPIDSFAEAVQKLHTLSNALEEADYPHFWATLESDDLYADLVADCSGFEELVRLRIAMAVAQAFREISKDILESYLNATGEFFEGFVKNVCLWTLDGDKVKVPLNKENEAITTVTREVVKIEQFSRVFKRAYEQPC